MLELRLPVITPNMSEVVIECLHAEPGAVLKAGSKLLDVSVDLSGAFAQDCPPVSCFRIVVRESAVLRSLPVTPGMICKAGDQIALFSERPGEPEDEEIRRGLRIAIAGIMHHPGMWTGSLR